MRIIAWCLIVVFAAMSLACIIPNYAFLWRGLRAKPGEKIPSAIPFMGGLLGFVAVKFYITMRTWPDHGFSWYTLLPAALDPGCYLIALPIMLGVWVYRKSTGTTTERPLK